MSRQALICSYYHARKFSVFDERMDERNRPVRNRDLKVGVQSKEVRIHMNRSQWLSKALRSSFSLAILLVVSAGSAFAQLSTATLNGVIRDNSGAVVAKATVVLRNVETTIEHATTSNDAGNYVFLNLTPGKYTLEISADGFSSKHIAE